MNFSATSFVLRYIDEHTMKTLVSRCDGKSGVRYFFDLPFIRSHFKFILQVFGRTLDSELFRGHPDHAVHPLKRTSRDSIDKVAFVEEALAHYFPTPNAQARATQWTHAVTLIANYALKLSAGTLKKSGEKSGTRNTDPYEA